MEVINNKKSKFQPKPLIGQVVLYSDSYYLIIDGANEYTTNSEWPYIAVCLSANRPYLTKLRFDEKSVYTVYDKTHVVID